MLKYPDILLQDIARRKIYLFYNTAVGMVSSSYLPSDTGLGYVAKTA